MIGRLDWIVPGLLLLLALLLRVNEPALVEQLRNLVFDSYQRLAPRAYEPQPVRIVDIDEESLKRLGQWPWPRDRLARLVDRLGEMDAAAVVLDILLAEPDRLAPENLAALWPDRPEFAPLQAEIAALPDPDAALADSLARTPAVTAFVLIDRPSGARADGRTPAIKAGFSHAGDDPRLFAPRFTDATVALPSLEAAARGNGSVNAIPDADGTIRRVPLLVRLGDRLYPSLAAEALRVAQGAGSYMIKASGASGERSFGEATGITHLRIGAAVVPTDARGRILLYDSGSVAARFLPAWRVLEPDFDPAAVAGRIALIGTSAEGLKDVRTTPLDPVMAGVEVHAQILEQMLSGVYLQRPDWATGAELLHLTLFGIVLIVFIRRVGALLSALVAASAIVIAVSLSWAAFARHGWLLDPLFASLVALLVYLSGSLLGYLRTEREKWQVRGAFGRYLSPVLVEELTRHPERLTLGGEMRELTLMFCDIRGFTNIAEGLDPQALTRLINGFLTPMTGVIQDKGGTIDKYIGDCIMAFWNAPLTDADHARSAIRAALAMRAELQRLNELWDAEAMREGRAPRRIAIGIGINTGFCCVGNMGSEQRFDYSVLGDAVNVASRLESLSGTYGVDLVIGERTAEQVPEMALIEIDQVRVKGRATPIAIYTALGDADLRDSELFRELAGAHGAMLAAYRRQDWPEAARALTACRALGEILAPLYELYERRIAAFSATPPTKEWDGVFAPTTKTG
ncbi:adenylate/guanylate cyclase domain-containing protein [Rhodospirillaceae bacterium SYSU D60014]|uniref:CHASE2 domain-containing protein n=1 Tax=Virgifigura deserti TaxID=2268457 RepID=UPI000E66CEB9